MERRGIPYDFVLEPLEAASAYTKPMFGCTGVYIGDKIVLLLREKTETPEDNGIRSPKIGLLPAPAILFG